MPVLWKVTQPMFSKRHKSAGNAAVAMERRGTILPGISRRYCKIMNQGGPQRRFATYLWLAWQEFTQGG